MKTNYDLSQNTYNNVVLHPTLICQAPSGEIEIYLFCKPPHSGTLQHFWIWILVSVIKISETDQQNSLKSCFPAWIKECLLKGWDSRNNDNDLQFMKYPVVVLKPRETPCIPAYCIITANCSAFTLLHFLWRFSLWQLNRHPKSKVWIKGMDWKLF